MKYAYETIAPVVPSCMKSVISLLFNGESLVMRTASGTLKTYTAFSGKPINGKFDYSVDRQKASSLGPIPEGSYWINPSDLWENNWLKSALRTPRSAWGDYRITIRVFPGTQTHSRGGFFIHGGDVAGSAGCIDLTHSMNQFVKDLMNMLGKSKDCYIPLQVTYTHAE